MLYSKIISGVRKVIGGSQSVSIKVESDHPEYGLVSGQWVSNPSEELLLADGWQVYVPPVPPYVPTSEASIEEKMNALLKLHSIGTEVVALDDESALALKALFPVWADYIGKEVKANERYFYDERLWRCIQTHTAQADWTPDNTPALFTEVSVEEWPEWRQPLGSEDAYHLGDKVSYNDQHWVSVYDGANVWKPGEYGWDVATD